LDIYVIKPKVEDGEGMKSLIYTVSLLLAALLGFAVHRASLCTVRTVAEIFSTRKAYMMGALLKVVLWVMAVSLPILLFLPGTAAPNRSYAITIAAIAGGFLFGVGAAVNGGCAFSTLWHLANGNLWMLTTLFGFCIGVAGLSIMVPMIEPCQALTPLFFKAPKPLILTVISLLWLFLCWEIFRLWKSRTKGSSWIQLFLSRYYRLSTAALVMGFSGGLLYALHGSWTYTYVLKSQIQSLWQPIEQPITINLLLFLALLGGMLLSAWQGGSLRLRWRRIQTWPSHLIGGTLMGAGAVLIPGGNDTLMLKSLPGLSPHAIPAMVALFFGIGVTLLFMRLLTGKSLKVVCTNDICQTEN
jgi:uncharacterized membrane protein YedE/YeeE